jgi:hypothetical protein
MFNVKSTEISRSGLVARMSWEKHQHSTPMRGFIEEVVTGMARPLIQSHNSLVVIFEFLTC